MLWYRWLNVPIRESAVVGSHYGQTFILFQYSTKSIQLYEARYIRGSRFSVDERISHGFLTTNLYITRKYNRNVEHSPTLAPNIAPEGE